MKSQPHALDSLRVFDEVRSTPSYVLRRGTRILYTQDDDIVLQLHCENIIGPQSVPLRQYHAHQVINYQQHSRLQIDSFECFAINCKFSLLCFKRTIKDVKFAESATTEL